MNLDPICKEIKKVIPLTENIFREFGKMLTVVHLEKGQVWEHEGKLASHLAFVNNGILRKYMQKNGNEFIEDFFINGDFIGNYQSYKLNEVSKSCTQALEKCELLTLSFERLEYLIDLSKNIGTFSNHIRTKRMFELSDRYSSMLSETPEERYRWLISNKPDLVKKIPQYYIAQYLGVTPETLSRIKKKL